MGTIVQREEVLESLQTKERARMESTSPRNLRKPHYRAQPSEDITEKFEFGCFPQTVPNNTVTITQPNNFDYFALRDASCVSCLLQ